MSYDPVSFFAGYATGLRMRGYASRIGSSFVPSGTRHTQFFQWAVANGGGTYFATSAASAAYAASLPVATVDNSGAVYWMLPACDWATIGSSDSGSSTGVYGATSDYPGTVRDASSLFQYTFDKSNRYVFIFPASGKTHIDSVWYRYLFSQFSGYAPISGYYGVSGNKSADATGHWSTTIGDREYSYNFETTNTGSITYYDASAELSYKLQCAYFPQGGALQNISACWYHPLLKIVPLAGYYHPYSTDSGNAYSPSGRAGNIRGDFSFTVNDVTSVSPYRYIIDEDNMTVYNPFTGLFTPFDSWTYNYMYRSYTCNTSDGSFTVTFGDNAVTINQSGATYTIYYHL